MREKYTKLNWGLGVIVLLLIALRGYFNALIPLTDKTEARYSEIARLMAETNNWVVLQIDYGIPFWAKPPLSTWASAFFIQWFGVSEFVVRLPYYLVSILMLMLVSRYSQGKYKYVPAFILVTLPEFFLHAGVVSTDVMLSFSVTLIMLSFWERVIKNSSVYWGYLFFIGIGLGLLAKGPIIGVLTLPPIFIWLVLHRNFIKKILRLPLVLGSLLSLAIALPWYILTEKQSSGFIDYFIVGEHFKRYFDSEWSGDKYGFPKSQPLGMIWAFLILVSVPWIILVIKKLITRFREFKKSKWLLFLLCWLLWLPFFFTSSKSLIHPYTLPIMMPLALIVAHFWETLKIRKLYVSVALAIPFILLVASFFPIVKNQLNNSTTKYLIEKVPENATIYAIGNKPYSSQFYTHGKIKEIKIEEVETAERISGETYFLIATKYIEQLPDSTKQKLIQLEENKKHRIYQYKQK